MGLLQRAAETYDNMSHLCGVKEENRAVLAPIGFMTTKADIEITIDSTGDFITASLLTSKEKVSFPVTEESSGRTSSSYRPHPLCDQLKYIADYDTSNNDTTKVYYATQLEEWCNSDYKSDKAYAVLLYVKKKTVIQDLLKINIIKESDDYSKKFVIWRVLGKSPESVCEDIHLMKQYSNFYLNKISNGEKQLCYVSGEQRIITTQHMKGVFSFNGGAKLISADDKNYNLTYKGRFIDKYEALGVSYEVSQKSHNALKWIIENFGFYSNTDENHSGRAFVYWNPKVKPLPKPKGSILNNNYDDENDELIFEYDKYKKRLNDEINGYKNNLSPDDPVVIAAFDAATTGRLSITYYNEFQAYEFLDRLKSWDETCCMLYFILLDNKKYLNWGISSPTLYSIIKAAFGTVRGNKIKTDDEIAAQNMQTLLSCRLGSFKLPYYIMRAAFEKSNNMQIYPRKVEVKDKSKDKNKHKYLRDEQIFITCAIIKKYLYDNFKEEFDMALEPERKDRSYQYGRILAVMEKAERDTYDQGEKREPNAIRMQPVFVKRPAYATKIIIEQLKKSYYPKLSVGARVYFEQLIGHALGVISEFDEDYEKALSETYLLGYYLQKNALYEKKNNENITDKSEENENE